MDPGHSKDQHNPSNNPSQGPKEVIDLTPDLLSHPLFLRTEDKILATLIGSLQSVLKPVPDTKNLQMHAFNFDNYLKETIQDGRPPQQVIEDFQRANASITTTCSKAISPNELYFRCLDCEVTKDPSELSHMCADCFHKSKHDGHRILKGKPLSPCACDCGRPDSLLEEGFCPNHKYKDQTVEEILADFPKVIRNQVIEAFRKTIYGVICLYEIEEKAKGKETKAIINSVAHIFMDRLLGFYMFLAQRVSSLFNLVIERLLQSSFEAPNNLVWHDCTDLKDENQAKNSELGQPNQCTCTVLGSLLRFSKFFTAIDQEKLNIVFMESCKEKSSRQFLNRELMKYVYFIVADPRSSTGDFKKKNSKQSELFSNTFSLGENDVEHLDHFLGALKRALSDYSDPDSDKYMEILVVQDPLSKFLAEDSKASLKVLQETDLIRKLLDLVSDFQANMFQPKTINLEVNDQMIDYGFFSVTVSSERYLYSSLDPAFKKLGNLEIEKKDALFKEIAKAWYDCYQKTKARLDDERLVKGRTSFQAGLERTLCLMIVHYLQNDITQEKVQDFFKKVFSEVDSSDLACNAVSGVLVSLGLNRFMDVIKTPLTRSMNGYYYNLLSVFEIDVVLIQMMTLFVNPQDIFSLFVKNFFSYSPEIQEFCLSSGPVQNVIAHPQSWKIILAIEDFLNFLGFFMNDEICLVNLSARKNLGRRLDDSVIERAIKKLLVNILIQRVWIDISAIKGLVNLFVFEEAQDRTDNVIAKITTRDEKTNKVKLNEEYEKDIDLNVFYKHRNGQREEHNRLTRAGGNSEACDIISGTFYPDLPEHMVALQHNIFQSQLPGFLCHILSNSRKEISHLVQPALRLVLFNLRVMAASLDNPNSKTEGLQKQVQENYLNESFAKTLNNIQAQADFKECEACIKNIKDLIKKLSSVLLPHQSSLEAEEVKENLEEEEEKKRQAKEKMEKTKEEFAKKQAVFAEKNDTLITKNTESPSHGKQEPGSPEKSGLVCQCCLDQIQETAGEEYGVPIHIEFTNNFYNTEEKEVEVTEQDYSELSQIQWWPVVSSCNHFYHRRCFEEHFKNSRGPQNQSAMLFMNEYETQCALCKTLCNNFLVVNNEQGKARNIELYSLEFASRILNILAHLRRNLLVLTPQKAQGRLDVPIEEIVRRGYEYVIESFHLYEKAEPLEGRVKFSANLFRLLKLSLNASESFVLGSKSVLKTLAEKYSAAESEKVSLELIVERIFFTLLTEESISTGVESCLDNLSINDYVRTIKEYVLASLLNLARLERPQSTLYDITELYKEDKELRDKAISNLNFPLQKIFLAYTLNRSVLNKSKESEVSDICKTICSSSHSDIEKIDLLLGKTDLPFTFEQLIDESLSLIQSIPWSEQDLLDSLLDAQSPNLIIPKLRLAPRFVQLPHSYLEFANEVTIKKCNLCKGHSSHLMQHMCLICGESLCAVACAGGKENLSRHALSRHMGLGLFYGIDNHGFLATKLNTGLIFAFGSGYTDEQGRPFTELLAPNDFDTIGIKRDLDFKRFVLSNKVNEFIKKVATQHSMGQEIFERASQNPQRYTNKYTY